MSILKGIGVALLVSGAISVWIAGNAQHETPKPAAEPDPVKATPAPDASHQPKKAAHWRIEKSKSAMDDSSTVYIQTSGAAAVQGWLASKTPVFVIGCKEGEVQVYVHTGFAAQPEYGGDIHVRYRIDSREAVSTGASESTNSEALFFGGADFVKELLASEAKSLTFEFTPFNSNPATARFDLSGLAGAIDPVRDACRNVGI